VVCEADTPEAIAATWDTHDNILVAQLHNKLARIDMRKAAEKDKKRAVDKLDIGSGDEVGGNRACCLLKHCVSCTQQA
jgi:hypothetical protein